MLAAATQASIFAASLSNVCIEVAKCDVADGFDLQRVKVCSALVMEQPLVGVWHLAGVLADGLLRSQTVASLRRVYAPKALGASKLNRLYGTEAFAASVCHCSASNGCMPHGCAAIQS